MSEQSLPNYNRYILARLGEQTIVFGDVLVREIMMVERNYILPLPFYDSAILGVIHRQGEIVSLASLRLLLGERNALIPEKLTVIHLSKSVPNIAGVGLAVDKIIGSLSREQYIELTRSQSNNKFLRIEDVISRISEQVWQPQRWISKPYVVA